MPDPKLLNAEELANIVLSILSYVNEPARIPTQPQYINNMAIQAYRLLDHIAALKLALSDQQVATAQEASVRMDAEARMARLEHDLALARAAYRRESDAEAVEQKRRIAAEAALETARKEIERKDELLSLEGWRTSRAIAEAVEHERQRCLRILEERIPSETIACIESGEDADHVQ